MAIPKGLAMAKFASVVAGAVALTWIAVYNGSPLLIHDSLAYYETGRVAAESAVNVIGRATGRRPAGVVQPAPASAAIVPATGGEPGIASTARSAYYGIFVYLSDKLGSSLLLVLAQALVTSWLLALTCKFWLPGHPLKGFLFVMVVATVFTSLPFTVALLMPDLFAGLFILAMALLASSPVRRSRTDTVTLFLLIVASFLFHRSHILIGGLLVIGSAAGLVFSGNAGPPRAWRSVLTVAVALVLGFAGFRLFDLAVAKATGRVPILPPFLLARVIEDGPGTAYLRSTCPHKPYAVCQFLSRLPEPSDDFLWSHDPAKSVWYSATPADKLRISDEQLEIVAGSVLHAPLAQLTATARNFGRQLVGFRLMNFGPTPEVWGNLTDLSPGPLADDFFASRIAHGGFDLPAFSIAYYLVVIVSMVLLLVHYRRLDRAMKMAALIIVGGVIVNALVTGAISEPDDRYQVRVIWLIPVLAVIVALRRRTSWAGPGSDRFAPPFADAPAPGASSIAA